MLIRSAHSANIKERRDASTALFDPDGEMVMQAEHIPVHLGAMPAAVAAVLDEEHAPGAQLDPQRSVPRRHPSARHHRHHAGIRGRRADRVRGQPRPPRRRRRPDARLDAGRQPHARRRGRGDRAAHPRRRRDRRAERRRCAGPSSAARTCARSSPPAASARAACSSCTSASAPTSSRQAFTEVLDYAERRTRACLRGARRRHPGGADVLEAARGRPRRSCCAPPSPATG